MITSQTKIVLSQDEDNDNQSPYYFDEEKFTFSRWWEVTFRHHLICSSGILLSVKRNLDLDVYVWF